MRPAVWIIFWLQSADPVRSPMKAPDANRLHRDLRCQFPPREPPTSSESVERQLLTRKWWTIHRHRYELVTSQYVLDEASMGRADRAHERVKHLAGSPLVSLSDQIDEVAAQIMARAILPKDAIVDALHIASAAVSRVDYLVTWNCSYSANPMILPRHVCSVPWMIVGSPFR